MSKSKRRFRRARRSDCGAVASLLSHLTDGHDRDQRHADSFEMKAGYESVAHLLHARAAATEEPPADGEYRAVLQATEGYGSDPPPWIRTLLCHLRLLGGDALSPPAGASSEPVPVAAHRLRSGPVFKPVPPYTRAARTAHIEGVVVVQLTLDPEGCVRGAEVLKGLPYDLDRSVFTVVRWWVLEPLEINHAGGARRDQPHHLLHPGLSGGWASRPASTSRRTAVSSEGSGAATPGTAERGDREWPGSR